MIPGPLSVCYICPCLVLVSNPCQYVQPYQSTSYIEEDDTTPEAGPSNLPAETPEKPRGRKRVRSTASLVAIYVQYAHTLQATPGTSAASLVANKNPPARSPTPPTRVVKSTYGGNLFTADDIEYLKKYIDYCQEQGLVLRSAIFLLYMEHK